MSTETRHPIQPLEFADDGILRFKANAIVKHLVKNQLIDLNELARMRFPRADWEQFNQLMGYSHSGAPVSDEIRDAAWAAFQAGKTVDEARADYFRERLEDIAEGFKEGVSALYGIHPDDLRGP